MRRERSLLAATGARSSVTRTIDTPPTHGAVVSFNFVYSRRLRKFDTDVSFFLGRTEGRVIKNDLVPPFFMRDLPPAETRKRGGVRDRIYRSGVKSGMRAGLLTDNLIQTTAGYAG